MARKKKLSEMTKPELIEHIKVQNKKIRDMKSTIKCKDNEINHQRERIADANGKRNESERQVRELQNKVNQSKRIYYLSTRPFVKDYMAKTKFKREFTMKTMTQKKFLPTKTQKAVDELIGMNCSINYTIK